MTRVTEQRMNQVVNRTMNWAVDQAVKQAVKQAAAQTTDRAVNRAEKRAVNQVANRVADQAVKQAVKQAVAQTTDWAVNRVQKQTVHRAMNWATDQAVRQAAKQAVAQTMGQAVNWAEKQAVNQVANRVADQAVKQAVKQAAAQTTDWAVNWVEKQAVNQAVNRATDQAVKQVVKQASAQTTDRAVNWAEKQAVNRVDQVVKQAVKQAAEQTTDWVVNRVEKQAADQAMNRATDQAVKQTVKQAATQTTDWVVNRAEKQAGNQAANRATDQVMKQAVKQAAAQTTDQAVNRVADQAVKQAVKQVAAQTTDWAVNRAEKQAVNQAVNRVADQAVRQAVKQAAVQTTDQAIKQTAKQATEQPAEQAMTQVTIPAIPTTPATPKPVTTPAAAQRAARAAARTTAQTPGQPAKKRVVVTGMGGVSPLGQGWEAAEAAIRARRNAVVHMAEWRRFADLHSHLACPLEGFVVPAHYPRKKLRSMGRLSVYAVRASELALADAGLAGEPAIASLGDGRMGVAYGSSAGSVEPIRAFGHMLETGSMSQVTSSSYVQMMPHTAAVNIGLFWDLKGRIVPTSCACASGSQAIGYAYEMVAQGKQTLMLAGGAEELSAQAVAVFDTLYATSTRNDAPQLTPRPFDAARDGLVIGEGAATLVLEEYEHARARGARIHAEIVGFGTNSDGAHITQPTAATMAVAMQLALDDAGLPASAIAYVNAHGTATDRGDVAESHATAQVFGPYMPISSLKSYIGHTLGACGAIEAWWTIEMMKRDWFAPTLNLTQVDSACAPLDYITGEARALGAEYAMSNNFAFGGINTALIFRRL